jgi:plastocyanin
MVVNKTASGSVLLAAILGVAVLQMIIQIVFFLHLGRGPKPLYNIAFFVSTVGIILVVVGGSIWIMHHLNYNMAPVDTSKYLVNQEAIAQVNGQKTGACDELGANHKVTITKGVVNPIHIEAKLCDTLTFIDDDTEREITFGAHPRHEAYAGEAELTVRKGRGKTITLSESGNYLFHDHYQPDVFGTFKVAPASKK